MHPADQLRSAHTIVEPDPRMVNAQVNRHDSILARQEVIVTLALPASAPEAVQIHFETAKNVLLYAWFVYRFHMVAEQYVLSTLEIALRTRLESVGLIVVTERVPGLSEMLKIARKHALIDNERFEPAKRLARRRAEHRQSIAAIEKMQREGLDEMLYEVSDDDIIADDLAEDWISQFVKSLPNLRNLHAHGTDMLHPSVFGTFEIVHSLVSQLFTLPD